MSCCWHNKRSETSAQFNHPVDMHSFLKMRYNISYYVAFQTQKNQPKTATPQSALPALRQHAHRATSLSRRRAAQSCEDVARATLLGLSLSGLRTNFLHRRTAGGINGRSAERHRRNR